MGNDARAFTKVHGPCKVWTFGKLSLIKFSLPISVLYFEMKSFKLNFSTNPNFTGIYPKWIYPKWLVPSKFFALFTYELMEKV